jgi:hypothetical protein
MEYYDLRRDIFKPKAITGVIFCKCYKQLIRAENQPSSGKNLLKSLIKWLAKVRTFVVFRVECPSVLISKINILGKLRA